MVLIVLGVLIALSLDAAWQYLVDRADERDLLLALQGEVADVQRVIDQIHCGPRYSQVDRVELIEPDSDNDYDDFIVSR